MAAKGTSNLLKLKGKWTKEKETEDTSVKKGIYQHPTVPVIMTSFIKDLNQIIKNLINLLIKKRYTMNGACAVTVVLNQQGVTTLDNLCGFDCCLDFENRFSCYKEKDINIGTTNGKDVFIFYGPIGVHCTNQYLIK